MAATPEVSPFTSIKERIRPSFDPAKAIQEQVANGMPHSFGLKLKPIAAFKGEGAEGKHAFTLPFTSSTYYELVDWTGRQSVAQRRGEILKELPPILTRLELTSKTWLYQANHYERWHARNAQASSVSL